MKSLRQTEKIKKINTHTHVWTCLHNHEAAEDSYALSTAKDTPVIPDSEILHTLKACNEAEALRVPASRSIWISSSLNLCYNAARCVTPKQLREFP